MPETKGSIPAPSAFLIGPCGPVFAPQEIAQARMRAYGFPVPDPWCEIAKLRQALERVVEQLPVDRVH